MDATNSSQSKFSFLRPYRQDDFDKVIRVFQTNVPQFFAPQEEQEFAIYLQEKREDYYIVEISEQVVGGGGINYFPQQHLARISWDFLRPDFQGKGYGKALTLYRIQKIQSDPQYDTVMVRTSQLAFIFYSKMGFRLTRKVKDFWAPGFDLYEMKLPLSD